MRGRWCVVATGVVIVVGDLVIVRSMVGDWVPSGWRMVGLFWRHRCEEIKPALTRCPLIIHMP